MSNCERCGKPNDHCHCNDHHHHCHDHPDRDWHFRHFKPCPGESPMETTARLYRAMNEMSCEFKQAIDGANGLINRLEKKSIYNGAYYDGVVTTEEGWSNEDSTSYKIIRIPHKDKGGAHIDLRLHVAYGNTTNSKVMETVFDASEFQLADKMVTAAVGDVDTGWQGLCRFDGAPIPSNVDKSLYTLGVTRHNRVKWYKNTVDEKQLERDCIMNSMGATGILVNAGVATDKTMWGVEAETMQKTARVVIGQNYETRETIILVVGDYDAVNNITDGKEYGMYPNTAANIMEGYCTVAINVALGSGNYGAAAVDKGEMLFLPSNAIPQKNYAYWYISRKSTYCNNYSFESATLRQLYGQLKWLCELRLAEVTVLTNRLVNVEEDIKSLYASVNDHTAQLTDHEARLEEIEKYTKDLANLKARMDALETQMVALNESFLSISEQWATTMTEWTNIKVEFNEYKQRLITLEELIASLDVAGLSNRVTAVENSIVNINNALSVIDLDIAGLKEEQIVQNERLDGLDGTTAELRADLEVETDERTSADAALQEQITKEVADRISGDLALSEMLLKEVADREAADTQIVADLEAETAARVASDIALGERLDNEAKLRADADEGLSIAIADETAARIAGDNLLQTNITAEQTAREAADAQLALDLAAEVQARIEGDKVNADAIAKETENREAGDTALGDALAIETIARVEGDEALHTRINNLKFEDLAHSDYVYTAAEGDFSTGVMEVTVDDLTVKLTKNATGDYGTLSATDAQGRNLSAFYTQRYDTAGSQEINRSGAGTIDIDTDVGYGGTQTSGYVSVTIYRHEDGAVFFGKVLNHSVDSSRYPSLGHVALYIKKEL